MITEKLDGKVVVTLDGRQISDLFFNAENSNFNGFTPDDNETPEAIEAQRKELLLIDARDFAEMVGGQVSPESLVADFMARL